MKICFLRIYQFHNFVLEVGKRLYIVYQNNIQFQFNLHRSYVVAPCSSKDKFYVNMQIMKEKGYLDTKLQKRSIVCFQEQMDRQKLNRT